jgi:hypothetical protein
MERRIGARDLVIFAAVVNLHYPLLELARVEFSYGLLPVQFGLIAAFATLTARISTVTRSLVYAALSAAYFALLSVLEVPFVAFGAYVTVMQTATAIMFIDYMLSLGRDDAQSLLENFQRLLARYILAFTVLVILIRVRGDSVLFNQVAQSNYMGLLTTYLIINLMRRRRVSGSGWRVSGLSLAENLLGEQRASFLLNAFTILRRSAVAMGSIAAVIVVAAAVVLMVAGDRVAEALAPITATASAYWALIPFGFANIEEIIKYAVNTPGTYDASILLRAVSMVYIGGQVIRHPMLPVDTAGQDYIAISHNLPLEYFKVGGLGFFVLSAAFVYVRYRQLFKRRYFRVDGFGILISVVYAMLFNDLFLGFLILPLALDTRPDASPSGAPVPAAPAHAPTGAPRLVS